MAHGEAVSVRGVWKRRAEHAADAAFAAKHPMPGADGWVENPFDKLDKMGLKVIADPNVPPDTAVLVSPADRRAALVKFIGSAREVKPK